MKKIISKITVVFLILSSNGIRAQTGQPNLDQFELWKQTIGTWEYKISKDSTYTYSIEPYGLGGVGWSKITVNDKTIQESRFVVGYNTEMNKMVYANLVKGKELALTVRWATAKNRSVRVDLNYVSNLDNAPRKFETEIKSPDMYTEYIYMKNKLVETKTWTRVKQ
jgi:hypothetical protein